MPICNRSECCPPQVFDYEVEPNTGDFLLTIQITPTDSGTVTGDGEHPQNEDVTVEATPSMDFEFVEWQDTFGNTLSEDAEYTFLLNRNMTIVAIFQAT